MVKKLNFGKIAFNGNRKINPVEVELFLGEKNGFYVFSACVYVYNQSHTNIICGGQSFDDVANNFKGNDLFNEIYEYWRHYHLNELNAGTYRQEMALLKSGLNKSNISYNKKVEYLTSIGLLFDKLTENESLNYGGDRDNYKYGTGWIIRTIPSCVVGRIKKIMA